MAKKTDRKGFFKRNFNISQWSDYERIKNSTDYLGSAVRRYFVPKKTQYSETFDEAVQRMGLSEEDLAIKAAALFKLSMVMLIISLCVFAYFILQLFSGTWRSVLISSVVMLLPMALAFRYHFLHFQIKHRKLGCSFREWARQTFKG
jgi:intracellular multiplication protein IcmV